MSFLFTAATPVLAWFVAVTSAVACLSFLRPVHTLMDSSTIMAEEEREGALMFGWCCSG